MVMRPSAVSSSGAAAGSVPDGADLSESASDEGAVADQAAPDLSDEEVASDPLSASKVWDVSVVWSGVHSGLSGSDAGDGGRAASQSAEASAADGAVGDSGSSRDHEGATMLLHARQRQRYGRLNNWAVSICCRLTWPNLGPGGGGERARDCGCDCDDATVVVDGVYLGHPTLLGVGGSE